MIYKVQFQIHRRGYRKLRLEGLYVPETGVEMSVPEMKRDVTEFIKRQLSSRNKEFENFQVELTVFKKLKTDFMYHPKSSEELTIIKEESDGTGEETEMTQERILQTAIQEFGAMVMRLPG